MSMLRNLSFARKYGLIFGVGLVLWVALVLWVVPWLIRDAYRGESLDILNRMISGREQTSLDGYLDLWFARVRLLTLVLLAAGVGLYPILRFRERLLAWGRELAGTPIEMGAGTALLTAVWFGIVGGFTEAAVRAISQSLEGSPRGGVYTEIYWVAPTAAALTLAACTLLLLVASAVTRGRIALGLAPLMCAIMILYSALLTLDMGLHIAAIWLLTIGAAVQISRAVSRHPSGFRRLLARTTPWFAAAVLFWGLAVPAGAWITERRTTAGLPDAAAGAPNVLLLILDTVRAPSLSLYGYERETTPELEACAEGGLVFERAASTAPWTLPSHASMFTGRHYHELSADWQSPLDDTYPTLAEELSGRGYRTGGFVANIIYTTTRSGLGRGFSHYEDLPIELGQLPRSWRLLGMWTAPVRRLFVDDKQELVRKTAEEIGRDFLDWVPDDGDRPWFAFLNYFDAHDPYLPPAPFNLRFGKAQKLHWMPLYRRYTQDELNELRDAYDSCLYYLDHSLGELFEELESRGLLENTLVIVTSDHGEERGEHAPDLVGHGHSLYWPSLHVPLVIAGPGVPTGRTAEAASIRDIPATVMGYIGAAGSPFPGTDLLAIDGSLALDNGSFDEQPAVLSQANPGINWGDAWPISHGTMWSLVRGPYHYIRDGRGEELLFNIVTDPCETTELSETPEGAVTLRAMRALVDAERR